MANMRKILSVLTIAFAFSSTGYAQENEKLFAMIYSKGKEWNEKVPASEQAYFKDHSLHLQRLRKQGQIIVGGRYSDVGFMILKAEDAIKAKKITKQDSSVVKGTFKVELFEFQPFYNGCIGKTEQE